MASVNGWATSFSAASEKALSSLKLPMSYPALKTGPSPVMIRQRASCSATTWAMQSRISWSSAPRLAGFEILIRVTPGAGSSRRTCPDASSVKDPQGVALRHRLAFLALALLHGAVVLRLDGHLHL